MCILEWWKFVDLAGNPGYVYTLNVCAIWALWQIKFDSMKWRGCSYQSVHTETVYPQQSLRSGFQTLQCLILNKRWRRCQIASWIEDVYFWCGASPGDHIFSCNTLMCHIGANYSFSHLLINLLVFLPHTRFLLLIDWPYITIRGLWIPIAALIC